jgi:torulene dioxygenase
MPNISMASPDDFAPAKFDLDVPLSKGIELPTVHPGYAHKRYRYAYGISKADQASTISDRLIKLDMDHPHIESHDPEEGAQVWIEPHVAPGEPVFIPNPDGTEEDDGVVLSVVLDGKVGTSMMLVLNAKDMGEIGRAVMDTPFPFGFHGSFVP